MHPGRAGGLVKTSDSRVLTSATAQSSQDRLGLVLDRPHWHEPLARSPCCLANRRRIDRIVLVAPDIGLHMRGRDQPHFEAERQQLPPPMMCR
jgi:hypothetical protein